MQLKARVNFWDGRTGSSYIGEIEDGKWHLWEKEWGGVKWAEVPPTTELVRMAEVRLRGLVLNPGGPIGRDGELSSARSIRDGPRSAKDGFDGSSFDHPE